MSRQGPQPLLDRVAARFSADDRVRRDVVVGALARGVAARARRSGS